MTTKDQRISRMRQTDWTRLLSRPKECGSMERIKYLVVWLMKARGSEKSKQRAISELRKLRGSVARTSN